MGVTTGGTRHDPGDSQDPTPDAQKLQEMAYSLFPSMAQLRAQEVSQLQQMFSTQATKLRAELKHLLTEEVHASVQASLEPVQSWFSVAQVTQSRWMEKADEYIY
uniref:Uncharacterized protein n=1 Tax=Arundo donax TaxID=35708 RepID=A0A0A9C7C2_ARUDO